MADKAKAKSAKERLEATKKSADEAEVLDAKAGEATGNVVSDGMSKISELAGEIAVEEQQLPDGRETGETPISGDETVAPENEESGNLDNPADEASNRDNPDTIGSEENDVEPVDEDNSSSLSATILKGLIIFIVGAGAALWAGPKIAPGLPGWAAPVAAFLTPGANDASARVDAIASETQMKIDDLSSDVRSSISAVEAAALAADEKATSTLGAIQQARSDLAAEIAEMAKEPRADLERMNELATRLVAAEATVEGLKAEVGALRGISTDAATPSAAVLDRVAAFGAAVEGLRAEIGDLKTRTAQIEALASSEDLAALSARVASLEGGEAATASARGEASDIRRSANIDAALTRIEQALLSGAPYASALSDATSLSGETAPSVLSENASTGLPTQEDLLAAFPVAAQDAYAASLEESADGGFASGVLAKLQGKLGGRPSFETEGEGAGAVLSRIEARLNAGRLGGRCR